MTIAMPAASPQELTLAVLTLTKELSVVMDRVHVLEALLARAGVAAADAADRFQPDAAFLEESARRRRRLLDEVLGAIGAPLP